MASNRPKHLSRGDSVRIIQPHRVVEGKVINSSEDECGYKIEMTDAFGHYQVWRELDGGSVEKIHIKLIDEVKELIQVAKVAVSFEEMPLQLLNDPDRTGINFENGFLFLVETDIETVTFSGKKNIPGYQIYSIRSSKAIDFGCYRMLSDAMICVLKSLIGERISSWEKSRIQDKDMTESESRIKL